MSVAYFAYFCKKWGILPKLVRCDVVEEENWCMQWSGEVLPEPTMVPDLRVFLCTVASPLQAVTGRRGSRRAAEQQRESKKIPARLKLPFIVSHK